LAAVTWVTAATASGQPEGATLVQRRWFEARTANFHTYSCGPIQEVAKLAARLEQFREAYSLLAGAQAVASPPTVVMAFPNHRALEPFLPLYQGKPANLAAFFSRNSDENLIVLYLSGAGAGSLELIFHEYTHLLLRHNERIWPLWLTEGMAEVYETFEVSGSHTVRIGKPLEPHLRFLTGKSLMPLRGMFAVTRESPEYNERERQGIFYAQSWLLTHYLMIGGNAAQRARFGQLTAQLRRGQTPEQAFTNAFQTTLPAMEAQLRRYLERGKFESLALELSGDVLAPRAMATRSIGPVEVYFRLGDVLLRVGRPDAAESYFVQGQKLAPKSPLPFEGLGLVAAERGKAAEAVRYLGEALQHGSISFLAHYTYAREKYELTADSAKRHARIGKEAAAEIQGELEKSLSLMPNFGPAHHLLGFFTMVQGENLAAAEQHLQRAIQLEPENQSYLFSLAQAQLRREGPEAACRTLETLRLPYVDAKLRAHAEQMIKEIARETERAPGK